MSLVQVQECYGTAALLRLLGALFGFLVLRALRAPLVLVIRALDAGTARMDALATGQSSGPDSSQSPPTSAQAAV